MEAEKFIKTNPEKLSNNTLLDIIETNNQIAKNKQKSNAISSQAELTSPSQLVARVVLPKEKKTNDQTDTNFEEEVSYYFSLLESLKPSGEEELMQELETVLPSEKNYQYHNLLKRLKSECYRQVFLIKELIRAELSHISSKELSSFQQEIAFYLQKMNLIDAVAQNRTNHQEEEEQKPSNRLVFLPISGDNIRVLEEVDSIAPEFYPWFLTLFNSIKDGTFKGVKKLTDMKGSHPISEVKVGQARVLFNQIDKNTYAIISMFVKKCATDHGYKNSLAICATNFNQYRSYLIDQLSNPEFLEKNQQYEDALYEKISMSPVSKVLEKKK